MVRRAWGWWRSKKPLVDFFFMLPLALFVLLTGPNYTGSPPGGEAISEPAYLSLAVGFLGPLIWRRRYPRTAFLIVTAFCAVQWAADIPPQPADLGFLVVLYTVAAECSFRWGLSAGLVGLLGAVMATFRFAPYPDTEGLYFAFFAVFVSGVWALGMYISTRRKYMRSLEDRAARLERERDAQVQIAMAGERARIARELHDVVAHNVSVMVVQADGASYAIKTDVDRAQRALETISSTGRMALAEMRRLLGVLREGDDAGSYAPQPGVEQLTDLVEQIRDAGLPLDFQVRGVPAEMSPGLQLTVFRVVQESLTNTLKHGGPGVTAQVRLHYGDDLVEVAITDDGRGAAARDDRRGNGLRGMAERVAVYGGTVRAGPRAGGGYEVVARLPVREEAETR